MKIYGIFYKLQNTYIYRPEDHKNENEISYSRFFDRIEDAITFCNKCNDEANRSNLPGSWFVKPVIVGEEVELVFAGRD